MWNKIDNPYRMRNYRSRVRLGLFDVTFHCPAYEDLPPQIEFLLLLKPLPQLKLLEAYPRFQRIVLTLYFELYPIWPLFRCYFLRKRFMCMFLVRYVQPVKMLGKSNLYYTS